MTMEMENLRAENAWLKSRLAEVQGDDDTRARLREALRLSPQQAQLLALLFGSKKPVTTQAIYDNVFEKANGDGPLPNIIRVQMSFLRKRIEKAGAPGTIHATHGAARYALEPALREWLEKTVTQ